MFSKSVLPAWVPWRRGRRRSSPREPDSEGAGGWRSYWLAQICHRIIRWGLLFLLVASPLVFGSVQPWAYTTMGAVVLFLLLVWFCKMALQGELLLAKLPFLIPVFLFAGVVLVQLAPLPPRVLSILSPATQSLYEWTVPRAPQRDSAGRKKETALPHLGGEWGALSVYPHATLSGWLKILSYLAVFLLVVNNVNSREEVRIFLWALILCGFSYSLFAIAQRLTWNGMAFWFIPLEGGRMPFGPYVNRNHFAGYIELILPLALAMALSRGGSSHDAWKLSAARLIHGEGDLMRGQLVTSFFMGAVMASALFLSLSRGGMVSALLSLMVFALLVRVRNVPGLKPTVMAAALLFVVLLMVVWLEFGLVSERVASFAALPQVLAGEARFKIWQDSATMLKEFPLFGVGLAAYRVVFPLFQTDQPGVFFTHPENDYLQLLVETGVIGAAAASAGAILFVAHVLRRFWALRDERMIVLAAGGLAAGSAIAVHSMVDFNLHIPANAFYFALIMGLLVVMVHLRGGERSQRFTMPFVQVPLRALDRRLLGGAFLAVMAALVAWAILLTQKAEDEVHFKKGERAYAQMLLLQASDHELAAQYGRRAADEFIAAIALNPLNYIYHYHLGWVAGVLHIQARRYGSGAGGPPVDYAKSFRDALRLFPSNPRLHYGVGMYHFLNWRFLSQPERAFGVLAFRRAVFLMPELKQEAERALRANKSVDPEVLKLL